MAHAWLDSLSEDWVSQPGSDNSQAQLPVRSDSVAMPTTPKTPKTPNTPKSTNQRGHPSRIPRLNSTGNKKSHQPIEKQSTTPDRSPCALGERSLSEMNIPLSQRTPSKLSRGIRSSQRGRVVSRSHSTSTSASVVHNTVEQQQKAHSASPSKSSEDIPEWKRRLVYGYLSYGESKDLFSSAATGLENIFRPPMSPQLARDQSDEEEEDERIPTNETTLPSSPPPWPRAMRSDHVQQQAERLGAFFDTASARQPLDHVPGQVKFRRTDDESDWGRSENSTAEGTAGFTATVTGTHQPTDSSFTSLSTKQRLDDASRKTSGQSIVRNEDFSPVLISRRSSEDGKVSFAPIEVPAQQLRKRLEKLRRNQMVLDSDPDSVTGLPLAGIAEGSDKFEDTDDFASKGGFLNTRRGGRSGDGSFRDRPLSPPPAPPIIDSSEMLPESSIQASTPKQLPTIRTERFSSAENQYIPGSPPSPDLPRAPYPSPEKFPQPHPQPPRSSGGSPLKLFGPYDTFTNQTLMRRISQFEDQMDAPSHGRGDASQSSIQPPRRGSEAKSSSSQNATNHTKPRHFSQARRMVSTALNQFGAGAFDGFEFSEDISFTSNERSHLDDKENLAPEKAQSSPDAAIRFNFDRHLSSDPEAIFVRRRRQPSGISASPRQRRHASRSSFHTNFGRSFDHIRAVQMTPRRHPSDSKRPWTSPSKDPTPKRRRTLHRSDIAYGLEHRPEMIEAVQNSHYSMQSAIDRMRKDSLRSFHDGGRLEAPAPNVLMSRRASRARTPTPSQRLANMRQRKPLSDIPFNVGGEGDQEPGDDSEIRVRDFAVDGSRMTSMKTQDFFHAAEEIMAMIRNKARPKISLGNVEESEAESAEHRHSTDPGEMDDSFQESTKEPLSRPPSREGAPVLRVPARQENPDIVSRLKQYEEVSEMGDLAYSMRLGEQPHEPDIHIPQDFDESYQDRFDDSELHRSMLDHSEFVSDLPNLRVFRNPDATEVDEDHDVEYPSNRSRESGVTSGRNLSSRGSDSRRLIAPDVVTDLIGDQVGNMVFDKDKKIWVKVKGPKQVASERSILHSEDSEEDPFASIPDLSVDTAKEVANLGLTPGHGLHNNTGDSSYEDGSSGGSSGGESTARQAREAAAATRSNPPTGPPDTTFERIKQDLAETAVEDDEEIEHEITLHEDRVHETSSSQRRNLTISFSSPIASIIRDRPSQLDGGESGEEPSSLEQSDDSIITESIRRGRHAGPNRPVGGRLSKSRSRSRSRGPPKNVSAVKREAFVPRPVSRIDEQDEDSIAEASTIENQVSVRGSSKISGPETGNESLSVVVTTPAPPRTAPVAATPLIAQYVGTLSLSPLSEFTMRHADQSCALEVSYVVGDHHLVTGDPSEKVLTKALRHLVEKITEVEPFEPDWSSMKELDVNNKQLTTLHKLDEFCTSVVTLDASNNAISHLDGVPESVRNLRMTHNHLSELTAWGHLMNLQYVDVSNNQLSSLYAFKDLVHLRNLRADNNRITSLDGINLHDSLQVLRVRNNLIEHVDFEGTRLQRLTDLDLEGNEISAVHNIEQLPCLATLNLQRNWLTSFGPTAPDQSMPCLRYLKLSDNDIVTMELSAFPSLRLLHADRNQLTTLTGFSRCRRLDSLSLREQHQRGTCSSPAGPGTITPRLDTSFLASAYEVRKLFLSGNNLSSSSFGLPVDFLNLQYLELANCGLRSLDPRLGQLTPNLRVLNLNFNALTDLAPLRYVPRLKKLLVAGNRLADARAFTRVLQGFPHLARLDARDNPATLGFYPPPVVAVAAPRTASREGAGEDGVPVDVAAEHQDQDQDDPFVLPDLAHPAAQERDARFQARVDADTRMRRRLYEVVVLARCRRLRTLDGLPARRDLLARRDDVWCALVKAGVVEADDAVGGAGAGEGVLGEREGEKLGPDQNPDPRR